MRTLGLLRHAKSSWAEAGLRDYDRPLNARGRGAALLMGEEMGRRGLTFDMVIASPARRTSDTVALLQKGAGSPLPLAFDDSIYAASAATLLQCVRGVDDGVHRLLLVAHNPGLQDLALQLLPKDGRPERQRVEDGFPTAALLLIQLAATSWQDVANACGTAEIYVTPRSLAARA